MASINPNGSGNSIVYSPPDSAVFAGRFLVTRSPVLVGATNISLITITNPVGSGRVCIVEYFDITLRLTTPGDGTNSIVSFAKISVDVGASGTIDASTTSTREQEFSRTTKKATFTSLGNPTLERFVVCTLGGNDIGALADGYVNPFCYSNYLDLAIYPGDIYSLFWFSGAATTASCAVDANMKWSEWNRAS